MAAAATAPGAAKSQTAVMATVEVGKATAVVGRSAQREGKSRP